MNQAFDRPLPKQLCILHDPVVALQAPYHSEAEVSTVYGIVQAIAEKVGMPIFDTDNLTAYLKLAPQPGKLLANALQGLLACDDAEFAKAVDNFGQSIFKVEKWYSSVHGLIDTKSLHSVLMGGVSDNVLRSSYPFLDNNEYQNDAPAFTVKSRHCVASVLRKHAAGLYETGINLRKGAIYPIVMQTGFQLLHLHLPESLELCREMSSTGLLGNHRMFYEQLVKVCGPRVDGTSGRQLPGFSSLGKQILICMHAMNMVATCLADYPEGFASDSVVRRTANSDFAEFSETFTAIAQSAMAVTDSLGMREQPITKPSEKALFTGLRILWFSKERARNAEEAFGCLRQAGNQPEHIRELVSAHCREDTVKLLRTLSGLGNFSTYYSKLRSGQRAISPEQFLTFLGYLDSDRICMAKKAIHQVRILTEDPAMVNCARQIVSNCKQLFAALDFESALEIFSKHSEAKHVLPLVESVRPFPERQRLLLSLALLGEVNCSYKALASVQNELLGIEDAELKVIPTDVSSIRHLKSLLLEVGRKPDEKSRGTDLRSHFTKLLTVYQSQKPDEFRVYVEAASRLSGEDLKRLDARMLTIWKENADYADLLLKLCVTFAQTKALSCILGDDAILNKVISKARQSYHLSEILIQRAQEEARRFDEGLSGHAERQVLLKKSLFGIFNRSLVHPN